MAHYPGSLGVVSEFDVDMPMRDGTLLRGNVFRPDAPGRWPGLLLRTPYGKSQGGFDRFVRAGYAVVSQDVRGRNASDGTFVVFTETSHTEAEDGYDSVEWLAAQPWCDGNVGTMGASYCGWTQWTLAKLRPQHLRAMCACSIPLEKTDVDWWGAFRPGRRFRWWLTSIAPDLRRRAGWPPPHDVATARRIWDEIEHGRWLDLNPRIDIVKHLPPPLDGYVKSWMLEPNRKAWKFAEAHREIEVPNLDFTGWFDHCNSLGHFLGMRANARTEAARAHTKVVCGPWAHGTIGKRDCHGVDFGSVAEVDTTDIKIRWFDRWLKGVDNGAEREAPMRYFVMGAGEWRNAEEWPPSGTGQATWHLASGGNANGASGDGRLVLGSPNGAEADRYRYDPQDPVPTLWTPQMYAGASNRRKLEHRRDILIYRTPPLEEDVEIVGHPEVALFAATTAPDTDWFARLADEEPGGPALEVSYGMVRARHRRSWDREEFVPPGEAAEYRIPLGPTACRFRKGHRIRLEIASSDYPNFDRNHNIGKNDLLDPEMQPADQTVFHSQARPSRLTLPLAP